MIQLTEYQLEDKVLNLYLQLFKKEEITEEEFKVLTNPLTCNSQNAKSIILKLFKKGIITEDETLECLSPSERYSISKTINIPYIDTSPSSGKDMVPYATICGCSVCNCILGNKLVDRNLYETNKYIITTTSQNTTN